MIDQELKKWFEIIDEFSYESLECQEAYEAINLYFNRAENYRKQINVCLNEYGDENYSSIIIEIFFAHFSSNREKLIYFLEEIFKLSQGNKDDFELLYLCSDFELELEDYPLFCKDIFSSASKYALQGNFYIRSAAIYLLTASYCHLDTTNQRKLDGILSDSINDSDWKIRYMTYEYLQDNDIKNFKLPMLDKIKGMFISVDTI